MTSAKTSYPPLYRKNQSLGTLHLAYFDNIVLKQIPEPTSWTLFGLGAFSFVALLVRRRKPTP
jgi:hypothetical protein